MSRGMGTDMTTTWIANGLSPDLPRAVVMHGDWQGVELAIWRSATGRLSAWKDRCPHRGMRLSHGFVRGETLACIYHGWVYGQDGACRHIPAHPAMVPPASIRAEAFACVEQDGVLWVAPAEATDAPPKLNGMEPVRSLPSPTAARCHGPAARSTSPDMVHPRPTDEGCVPDASRNAPNLRVCVCVLKCESDTERRKIH